MISIAAILFPAAASRAAVWQGGTGNWSAASSNPGWNGAVPNAIGAVADFTSIDTTNRTTTQSLVSGVTIGSLNYSNSGAGHREIRNDNGITFNQDSGGSGYATISVSAGTLNSLRITTTTSASITLADDLKITNNSTVSTNANGAIQIGSVIAGTGNLTLSSAQAVNTFSSSSTVGGIRLTSTNTFSGNVNVENGLVAFTTDSAFGNSSNVITLGVSGSSNIPYLISQSANDVNNNIVIPSNVSKAVIGNTSTAIFNDAKYTGTISIGTGSNLFVHSLAASSSDYGLRITNVISGDGTLTKVGDAFGYTTLGNANTYTGKTSVESGGLKITSFNSVNGGTSSSSLGAPTTIANGTISLGSGTNSGSLYYVGSSEITDRPIDLASTGTGGGMIETGGTSILTLTGGISSTTASAKTFTLSGFSAHDNTVQGNITNGASSAISLAKTGTGKWILAGNNSYTGNTTINGGTLQFNSPSSIGGTGKSITVSSGSSATAGFPIDQAFLNRITSSSVGAVSLAVDSANPLDFSSAGADLATASLGATGTATYSGILTPHGATYRLGGGDGTLTVESLLSGDRALSSIGRLVLTNQNTFSGKVTIASGTLSVSSLNRVVGGTASSNLGVPTTAENGTIEIGSGATLRYIGPGETTDRIVKTTGNGGRIIADGSGAVVFESNMNSPAIPLYLEGESAHNNAINGSIPSASSLRKAGTGKWILNGANTFTGKTTIDAGTLSVSSLNKVVGGTASSNLGSPTTATNGTIALGTANSAGTLLYTGPGETTDRAIGLVVSNFGGIIDSSGTGPLVFNALRVSMPGSPGNFKLTLQGTNTNDNTFGSQIDSGKTTEILAVVKSGTGKWILGVANSYVGPTVVENGLLEIGPAGSNDSSSSITIHAPGSFLTNHIRTPSLTVDGLATVRANGGTTGASKVETLTIGANGKLNLKDNDLVIGTGNLADVRTMIKLGSTTHTLNGIISDSIGFGTTRGFGYTTGDDPNLSPLLSGSQMLTGQSFDSNSVLVKYTFLGDADLDGDSDLNDLGLWAQSFTGDLGIASDGTPVTYWTNGDFDYDGDTDLNDLGFWASTFTGDLGGGAGSLIVVAPNAPAEAVAALTSMGITIVPEPSTLLAGAIGLATFLRTARRKQLTGS